MTKTTIGLLIGLTTGCASTRSIQYEQTVPITTTTSRCINWSRDREILQTVLNRANLARIDTQDILAQARTNFDQADQLLYLQIKIGASTYRINADREAARISMKRALRNLEIIDVTIEEVANTITAIDYECDN